MGGRAAAANLDGDGALDLLLFFRTRATGIECGTILVSLEGATHDGEPIGGEDGIVTVGCLR